MINSMPSTLVVGVVYASCASDEWTDMEKGSIILIDKEPNIYIKKLIVLVKECSLFLFTTLS